VPPFLVGIVALIGVFIKFAVEVLERSAVSERDVDAITSALVRSVTRRPGKRSIVYRPRPKGS